MVVLLETQLEQARGQVSSLESVVRHQQRQIRQLQRQGEERPQHQQAEHDEEHERSESPHASACASRNADGGSDTDDGGGGGGLGEARRQPGARHGGAAGQAAPGRGGRDEPSRGQRGRADGGGMRERSCGADGVSGASASRRGAGSAHDAPSGCAASSGGRAVAMSTSIVDEAVATAAAVAGRSSIAEAVHASSASRPASAGSQGSRASHRSSRSPAGSSSSSTFGQPLHEAELNTERPREEDVHARRARQGLPSSPLPPTQLGQLEALARASDAWGRADKASAISTPTAAATRSALPESLSKKLLSANALLSDSKQALSSEPRRMRSSRQLFGEDFGTTNQALD